jgi:excisionase family DNA binding protein
MKLNEVGAAEVLGVSRFTVRAWTRARRLPHFRLGRRIVYDAEELKIWFAAHRVPRVDEIAVNECGP